MFDKNGEQIMAGWFPDPDGPGQLRYFDGTGWTEHRSPNPALPLPRTPIAKRRTRRARLLASAIALPFVVAAVVVLATRGSTSSPDPAAEAAFACVAAYQSGADYASGRQSFEVTMYALQRAELQARQAARQVSSYRYIDDNIVGLEADLSGSGTGISLRLLDEDCGPAHR